MGIKKKPRPRRKANPVRSSSLVDALFTATQQSLLRLLFGQPGRKFFATELIELAGKGSGAVQRELSALAESGLVTTEIQGRQKYYQANHESPIYHELTQITLKTIGLEEPIRSALNKIKGNIELALIFGSIAKGTANARSDIDLLIVSDELSLEMLHELLSPVEALLARKISPTLYKLSEFIERINSENPFVQKLLNGPYILLIGDPHVHNPIR